MRPPAPYTGSQLRSPSTSPSGEIARARRTSGSSASCSVPRVKRISGRPLSPTQDSEIAFSCWRVPQLTSASLVRRNVIPSRSARLNDWRTRAHALPWKVSPARSMMVSSATVSACHPSGRCSRVRADALKKHGVTACSSAAAMNSRTESACPSGGPSGSASAIAAPERSWNGTIPPEDVRRYSMLSHVVIHDSVPPPSFLMICFTSSTLTGVPPRLRARRHTRNAARVTMRKIRYASQSTPADAVTSRSPCTEPAASSSIDSTTATRTSTASNPMMMLIAARMIAMIHAQRRPRHSPAAITRITAVSNSTSGSAVSSQRSVSPNGPFVGISITMSWTTPRATTMLTASIRCSCTVVRCTRRDRSTDSTSRMASACSTSARLPR